MSRIFEVVSVAKDGAVYRNSYRDYYEWADKINQDREAGYEVSWDVKEDSPEPEWWGERFNQAMSIVKRLAYTESLSAFMSLREEARELAKRHSEASKRSRDE